MPQHSEPAEFLMHFGEVAGGCSVRCRFSAHHYAGAHPRHGIEGNCLLIRSIDVHPHRPHLHRVLDQTLWIIEQSIPVHVAQVPAHPSGMQHKMFGQESRLLMLSMLCSMNSGANSNHPKIGMRDKVCSKAAVEPQQPIAVDSPLIAGDVSK
jgi:hypothetical protein